MARFLASLTASIVWLVAMLGAAPAGEAEKLVLFPFELIDAAQDPGAMGLGFGGGLPKGASATEVTRLDLISKDLERRIREDGRYALVAADAIADDVKKLGPIHKCNGCEDDIAKKAGARLALIATVEKLSDLLFNFNLYLRDVEKGAIRSIMSTTIQGSTDEAWLRGIRYLAERKLFQPGDAR